LYFDRCTPLDDVTPWCYTRVHDNLTFILGEADTCRTNCDCMGACFRTNIQRMASEESFLCEQGAVILTIFFKSKSITHFWIGTRIVRLKYYFSFFRPLYCGIRYFCVKKWLKSLVRVQFSFKIGQNRCNKTQTEGYLRKNVLKKPKILKNSVNKNMPRPIKNNSSFVLTFFLSCFSKINLKSRIQHTILAPRFVLNKDILKFLT
jgi:hypothetical protein